MKANQKNLAIKAASWLIAEVILNLVGLDNLADYSEFVFDQRVVEIACNPVVATTLLHDQTEIPHFFA